MYLIRRSLVAALALVACGRGEGPPLDFEQERGRMVREQIVNRGVLADGVLAAMRKVPREVFVPGELRDRSYTDQPLPIGYDQTISQPYIVALMSEQARIQPSDRVLEIGTGSGYEAAVLAEMAAEVYTIEIIAQLAHRAEKTLEKLGYKNVHLKIGDGYKGWPEQAPFDAIIVTCAPDHIPQPLTEQLKEGGRMVIPVGERLAQQLYLLQKRNGTVKQSAVLPVRFVPMTREGSR